MALVKSNVFELEKLAPDFKLLNVVNNKFCTLSQLKGKNGTVVMYICNHCPYVVHIKESLVNLANKYIDKGIRFIAINSNDIIKYPQDSPEKMREKAKAFCFPFPYLFDESQEVANAYDAACTPDFYVFDKKLKAVYHGQFDDSRPGNFIPVTGKSIREALDNLLTNKSPIVNQKPSIGCSIKWK